MITFPSSTSNRSTLLRYEELTPKAEYINLGPVVSIWIRTIGAGKRHNCLSRETTQWLEAYFISIIMVQKQIRPARVPFCPPKAYLWIIREASNNHPDNTAYATCQLIRAWPNSNLLLQRLVLNPSKGLSMEHPKTSLR